ncbi:protein tramtrack, beta isoform isoform X2 [Spodoptera frugiperda]|uniref:Protein tramtrack, beta isoform isoform X2 n=1 Tax=Spodoptera frugiperda TaxID=7108 RepID=A0A9R0EBT5_SPOFR|nr:protein tramtrack, beta isoform isoform X2 [Spodoptera frugiperda]
MDQQFSLSWNNFHGNLTKGFAGLLGNGEFVDVTIAVEGHLLQAHKVILSICSPYFKKMFQLNPCQHPIVVLRDVTHKAMKDLLQFMYHGEVSVKREDLTSFIGTAEVLQIKGLTNKETEEDEDSEREQDLPKHRTETQNNTPDAESCVSDNYDTTLNDETTQSNELELLKQRQLIEKLHRISNLKRKSTEFLQKNYFSDILNPEKRPKTKEKIIYTQNNQMYQSNNYENMKNMYEDNPVDISASYNTHISKTNSQDFNEKSKDQSLSDNGLEMKTECDDSDIIVTDPAVCSTPKNYESSREGKKDLSVPIDYPSPQDSALSLVVNGSNENQQLPVRYKYIYSRKGHKQLVHMNFVYTKHSTTHGKTSWRCVQYFSLNRCPATVETIESMIYAINHQHNHEDCYEKLSRNNIYEMCVSPK